eukprot:m51a1_g5973 putative peptidase m4 (597) ;mRNA; r:233904-236329
MQSCFSPILPPHLLETLAGCPELPEDLRSAARGTLELCNGLLQARRSITLSHGHTFATPLTAKVTRSRIVCSAGRTDVLPGAVVRSEGGPEVAGDAAANECYEALGATFDFFSRVFRRNSLDGYGMKLLGTVHYGTRFQNCFWNGLQLVFGDGDGSIFKSLTSCVDVVAHELMHGVTMYTAGLELEGQPGALNESISDVFGSMVKQWSLRQDVHSADWLIGSGLFGPAVAGKALRSLSDPGTAYNDRILGRDPQVSHMAQYVSTTQDSGGVHINSGIPNKAFFLASMGLGGNSWERSGRIWYTTLCDRGLASNATFEEFASLSASAELLQRQLHSVGLTCQLASLDNLRMFINDVKAEWPHDGAAQVFGVFAPPGLQHQSIVAPDSRAAKLAFQATGMQLCDIAGQWEPDPAGGDQYSPFLQYIQRQDHFDWLWANRPSFTGWQHTEPTNRGNYTSVDALKRLYVQLGKVACASVVRGIAPESIEALLSNIVNTLNPADSQNYNDPQERIVFLCMNYNPTLGTSDAIGCLTIKWHLVIENYRRKSKDGGNATTTVLDISSRSVLYSDVATFKADYNAALQQFKDEPNPPPWPDERR